MKPDKMTETATNFVMTCFFVICAGLTAGVTALIIKFILWLF